MIILSSLRPSDVGRKVLYHPHYGETEIGNLTSWNKDYVFVRFRGASADSGGVACSPADVSFLGEERKEEDF